MRKTSIVRTFAFTGFAVLVFVVSASPQSISESGPGRISVEAEKVPLATLMKELGNITILETVIIAPEVENLPVSVTIKDVPIKEALQEILEAAGMNHTVWGGNGEPFRIYAGLAEDAVISPHRPNENDASESPREAMPPSPPPEEPSTAASAPGQEEPAPTPYPVGGNIQSPTTPSPAEPPPPTEPSSPGEPPPAPGKPPAPAEPRTSGELNPPAEPQPPADDQPLEELQPPEAPPQRRLPLSRPRFASGGAWFAAGNTILATGNAILATDGALLRHQPDNGPVVLTTAILSLSLALGAVLVRRPAAETNRKNPTA